MGTQTKRIQYLYDDRGHRKALIDHDGGRCTYSYDSVGRISVVQNAQRRLIRAISILPTSRASEFLRRSM